jgi:hypothetical protein
LEALAHGIRHFDLLEAGVERVGMCVDEVLSGLFGDDVDAELRALFVEKRFHHPLEEVGELVPDFLFLAEGCDVIATYRTAKPVGISLVEPQVITGAQSKKGLALFCCSSC